MSKYSKFKYSFFTFILYTLYFILYTTPVHAAYNPALGPDAAGLTEIEGIFRKFISVAVFIGFIACLVMLVMAGFKYLTSGGEPKAIQSAHQVASWAFLGILFMAISWLILQLIGVFTGLPVTEFNMKIL